MVPVSCWQFLICIMGGVGSLENLHKRQLNVFCLLFVLYGQAWCWNGGDPVVMVELRGVTTDTWYISYIAVLG